MHVHLVVMHHQRHDVACLKEVAARVDDAFETQEITGRLGGWTFEVIDLLTRQVAPMFKGRLRAGDIPAAPAFSERGGGSDVGTAGAAERFAVRVGKDRACSQRGGVFMARVAKQAVAVARK